MLTAKKSLGQHWLKDEPTLKQIVALAELKSADTVLEVGPGQGDLTRQLIVQAGQVVAVEKDESLAATLTATIKSGNLRVIEGDILQFDLTTLPPNYKAVANIPYYLTSNLIRVLSESINPPAVMVFLVQKEVAERVAASAGQTSLLSVSTQLFYEPKLGPVVLADMFEPPPKVDSQVIVLRRRQTPLFMNLDTKIFFQVVKAGFAGRRKKLRSSLAAGLRLSKPEADGLLNSAGIDGNRRAQELSLQDWHKIYTSFASEHSTRKKRGTD